MLALCDTDIFATHFDPDKDGHFSYGEPFAVKMLILYLVSVLE